MPRLSNAWVRLALMLAATSLPWLTLAAQDQSLGDVARQSREKKPDNAPAKVITNADLPKDPDGTETSGTAEKPNQHAKAHTKPVINNANALDPHAASQWQRQIVAQKRVVAAAERRLERFRATIPNVDASANARGEVFNRRQAWEQERLATLQEELDEQRAKFEELQESARRAGMHTQTYDP